MTTKTLSSKKKVEEPKCEVRIDADGKGYLYRFDKEVKEKPKKVKKEE